MFRPHQLRIFARVIPVLAGLMAAHAAVAQFVADGGTRVLNNVATNLGAGDLVVGTNARNTILTLTNGTVVSSGNAYLGLNVGASNSFLAVSSPSSRLFAGGAGSVFRIGNGSSWNQLILSQGGVATNSVGVIGYPATAGNNSVLVTDPGSAWTNGVFNVGESGSENSLTVANGGWVVADVATVGVVAGASNNWVTLSGSNSGWSTLNTLTVGDAGGSSRVAVNRGATFKAGAISLGNQATSDGNRLSVAGTNTVLTVTNSAGTGTLDVRRGVVEFNGGAIATDMLRATNAAGDFIFNDGTLVTHTATIANGQNFVVGENADTGPAGATFAFTTSNNIPSMGPASIYPAVINVTNVGGAITKVTITLTNLTHTYPEDLDILLVGPGGQRVMLMSDTAGQHPGLTNVTLTFDDAALTAIPLATNPPSGTYRPTDVPPIDVLPRPAPAGAYSTNLADFIGSSANGAWSLYVVDGFSGDFGSLGGWSLNVVTTSAGATWDVRSNAVPTTVTNALIIGGSAANARLLITNGATLSVGGESHIGDTASSSNNLALIAGPGTRWTSTGLLWAGVNGSDNSLVVSNGAKISASAGTVVGNNGSRNHLVVSGTNSALTNLTSLDIGFASGSFNTGEVNGGGALVCVRDATLGTVANSVSNVLLITDSNSTVRSRDLRVGLLGSYNTLLVTNGGGVLASNLYLGFSGGSNNLVQVHHGTITVTNNAGTAELGARRGKVILDSGTITADRLLLNTGSSGTFAFNGGNLNVRSTTVANGAPFVVGNGSSNAVLKFSSSGTQSFANGLVINTNATVSLGAGSLSSTTTTNRNGLLFLVGNGSSNASYVMSGSAASGHSFPNGLRITNNATLSGNGTVSGIVTVNSGGTLSPGGSTGKILLNNPPVLQGKVVMKLSKNGATLTNDVIQVAGTLTYSGSLIVTNLGPTALALSNNFPLFSATSYAGAFSSITLPALPPGLSWTNRLATSGSIMVIGVQVPGIGSIASTGTNVILNVTNGSAGGTWNLLTATNVELPVTNWTTNSSGVFNGQGKVSITNGVDTTEPKRFYQIKTP